MENGLGQLEDRREAMVDFVSRLANVNSHSEHRGGLAKVSEMLLAQFSGLGPDSIEASQLASGALLSFAKRADAPLQVLLVIHYDTVYEPGHPFQTVTREGAMLRGPGVADAKGGIVIMLNALLALEKMPEAKNLGWRVLLNPDEEIGSPGSAPLLVEAAKSAHLAMVFEPAPSATTMVTQRKGSGNFSVTFRGRSAHAGREIEKGRNAVLAASRFAIEATAAISSAPQVTINVGKIDGGGPVNVVPDLAILRFNVRVVTVDQQREVKQRLDKMVEEANRDGITAELSGGFSSPPWEMDDRGRELFEQLRAAGKELGMELSATSSGGASDANKIASAGIPVLDSLGPVGFDIHSPDERVEVDSLVQRAKLSALFLDKLASGQILLPGVSMK